VVICIVDASNLERNLYLVSQVLELGRPIVIALNMIDIAKEKGVEIDIDRLRSQLGVPIIPLQANRKKGLADLRKALFDVAKTSGTTPVSPFPEAFQKEVAELEMAAIKSGNGASSLRLPRYLVERLLLDSSGYLEGARIPGVDQALISAVGEARQRLAKAGTPVPGIEAVSRYRWVNKVLEGAVRRSKERKVTLSDRLDRVLTHKVFGTLVFILLMTIMFQAVTHVAVVSEYIKDALGVIAKFVDTKLDDGAFKSLVISGMVEGVGSVLVFLPQIFALFFFIAILEDCGYMARAAYLMDRLMSRIGLSGKSFIPLLSSFACAIPGIMSARVLENRRDRLVTILVAPLMSCSARLPV
jgi:ferrous iron transport protein B